MLHSVVVFLNDLWCFWYVSHFWYRLKCPTYTKHKAFLMMTFSELILKYMKALFRSNGINNTGSNVTGLKFSRKLGSPFLWIKMVVTLVCCAGRVFKVIQSKYLTWMILSMDITWSKLSISNLTGMVEPEDFMHLIIRVILC